MKLFFAGLSLLVFCCTSTMNSTAKIHIRVNQVGYLPKYYKSAVVLSNEKLEGVKFEVINLDKQKVSYAGIIKTSIGSYASFKYSYQIEFTDLRDSGEFQLKVQSGYSDKFKIGDNIFINVPARLLSFFRVQRCGYTNPDMHDICHKFDATSLWSNGSKLDTTIDLTGGWHDAGDYVKFLSTTAYSTYTLLFAYDFNRKFFEFDYDRNNTPDILEEAKVGLDWMLRCNFDKFKLVTQVQDLRDHTVGWRLPENDSLQADRPAILGSGKNLIGLYTATMALASKIWRDRFHSDDFADECLNAAENLYSERFKVADVDKSTNGIYEDKSFYGKLALGAIELYNVTLRKGLLKEAKEYADNAGPDYWWSYGEISDFAFYRLAEYDNSYADMIEKSLIHFEKQMQGKLFGQGVEFYWGSNHTMLGITLKNILWNKIKRRNDYQQLAINQVDYILGKNPWGISFISGTGKNPVKNLHHQISFLLKKDLPGGFAAGPVKKEIMKSYSITYDTADNYKDFQTDDAYYRDDRMDYVTNEPTIIANATGIFVLSNLLP